MKALVLAGGSGTRLWPLSRNEFPKQFLKIEGNKSLLQQTLLRNLETINPCSIFVLTNQLYYHTVKDQLDQIDQALSHNIILEPCQKNTAPAIALALKYMLDNNKAEMEETIFVTPSDHIISCQKKFTDYVFHAENLSKQGRIITFGIKPSYPETGYGYVQIGPLFDERAYTVLKFHEKPKLEIAQKYLQDGNYLWNSGMFAFKISTLFEEFEAYAPDIAKNITISYEDFLKTFSTLGDISIDCAVMEKSKKTLVLPLDLAWSDVGSWDNVYDHLNKDQNGNAISGNIESIDTKNSLILADKRLIATIGLEDMLIVETQDVILIAKKSESQKIYLLEKQNQKL